MPLSVLLLTTLGLSELSTPAQASLLRHQARTEKYNPEPEETPRNVTTFANLHDACQSCVSFYPEKQDCDDKTRGLYKDPDLEGEWAASCHAGPCEAQEHLGLGAQVSDRQCITLAPVSFYANCEKEMLDTSSDLYDLTRYCSYKNQIFLPPAAGGKLSPFAGVEKPFTRFHQSREQCMVTIAEQGRALLDDKNVCDSNLNGLSVCCDQVEAVLRCVVDEGNSRGILGKDVAAFNQLKMQISEMLGLFEQYCTPLCANDHEEFCAKYPFADNCIKWQSCDTCTGHGGAWCKGLSECQCVEHSGTEACPQVLFTKPAHCEQSYDTPAPMYVDATTTTAAVTTAPDFGLPSCKYLNTATVWSQDPTPPPR